MGVQVGLSMSWVVTSTQRPYDRVCYRMWNPFLTTSHGPSDGTPVSVSFVHKRSRTLDGRTSGDGDCRWGDGVVVTTVHERTRDSCPKRVDDDDDSGDGFVRRVSGPLTDRDGWCRTRLHTLVYLDSCPEETDGGGEGVEFVRWTPSGVE